MIFKGPKKSLSVLLSELECCKDCHALQATAQYCSIVTE
jgi:hypothetical protein